LFPVNPLEIYACHTTGEVLSNLIPFEVTLVVLQFDKLSHMFGLEIAQVAVADSILIVHPVFCGVGHAHVSV
jgi:hypothetical protein